VPTNPELDQLSRELAAEGILPGDQWWPSVEGTHAVMKRVHPHVESQSEA
jgi:hypothetical protein